MLDCPCHGKTEDEVAGRLEWHPGAMVCTYNLHRAYRIMNNTAIVIRISVENIDHDNGYQALSMLY